MRFWSLGLPTSRLKKLGMELGSWFGPKINLEIRFGQTLCRENGILSLHKNVPTFRTLRKVINNMPVSEEK